MLRGPVVLSPPAWVFPGATAHLDFVNNRYWALGSSSLAALLSVSRASSEYVTTSSGLMVPVGSNVIARGDLGAQIFQSGSNSIRNSSASGAVIGTPGTPPTNWGYALTPSGITTSIVGTGTENGLPYVDIGVVGTPGSTNGIQIQFENTTAIAALTGQTWTSSFYARLSGGSLANVGSTYSQIYEWTSAGGFITAHAGTPQAPTSKMARYVQTAVLSGGGTTANVNNVINLSLTTGQAVNFTVRLYAPQMEQLAFASPPILTSGSAGTRAGDNLTAQGPLLSALLNVKALRTVTNNVNWVSGNNSWMLRYGTGGQLFEVSASNQVLADNPSNLATATLGTGTVAGVTKSAFGFDTASFTAISNGGAKATNANTFGSLGGAVNIGSSGSTNFLNGNLLSLICGSLSKTMFDNTTTAPGLL